MASALSALAATRCQRRLGLGTAWEGLILAAVLGREGKERRVLGYGHPAVPLPAALGDTSCDPPPPGIASEVSPTCPEKVQESRLPIPGTEQGASFIRAGNCSWSGDKRGVRTPRERNRALSLKGVLHAPCWCARGPPWGMERAVGSAVSRA